MAKEIDNPEEILPLVNERDEVVGQIAREEVLSLEATGKGFTRTSLVFIVNDEGKLWIPVRASHKKIAPNGFDSSVAEHIGVGESYEAAALRGLVEECNIQPDPNLLEYVGKTLPFPGLPYFGSVYVYRSNETPEYNTDDYSGYEWISTEELIVRIRNGVPAKDILLPAVQLLL